MTVAVPIEGAREGVGFMRSSELIIIDDSKATTTLVYKLRLPLLHTMLL